MSQSFSRFEIASEDTNPGGTTIIKVVDTLNHKHTIGFAVCHNYDGKVIKCAEEDAKTLFDLLHFLQDKEKEVSWHMAT